MQTAILLFPRKVIVTEDLLEAESYTDDFYEQQGFIIYKNKQKLNHTLKYYHVINDSKQNQF